jgi:hypothetical protein
MDWPVRFAAEMSAGTISVRPYEPADAAELFESLADERAWQHMPSAMPADAAALGEGIRSRLANGYRVTFTIRQGGCVVGMASVMFDPTDPAGAEVGATTRPGRVGTGVARRSSSPVRRDSATASGVQLRTMRRTDDRPRSGSWARQTSASGRSTPGWHTEPDLPPRPARTVNAGLMTGNPAFPLDN